MDKTVWIDKTKWTSEPCGYCKEKCGTWLNSSGTGAVCKWCGAVNWLKDGDIDKALEAAYMMFANLQTNSTEPDAFKKTARLLLERGLSDPERMLTK